MEIASSEIVLIKPEVSRDDWIKRFCLLAIGLFLTAAVLLPLYTMLSKSMENHDGEFILVPKVLQG